MLSFIKFGNVGATADAPSHITQDITKDITQDTTGTAAPSCSPQSRSPHNTHYQGGVIEALESNYIFWFNNSLKLLYSELDELCPPITQKQISRAINREIVDVLSAFRCNGVSSITQSSPQPCLLQTLRDEGETAGFDAVNRVYIEQFSALLHLNIRLTRSLGLEYLSIDQFPISPCRCCRLFYEKLSETVIAEQHKKRLRSAFAQILTRQFSLLLSESNALLLKSLSNDTNTNTNTNTNDTPSAGADGLHHHREEVAAQMNTATEEAIQYAHDAIVGILAEHRIDTSIHPLIHEWEKYLFKVYLSQGVTSSAWSRGLRTIVSIRRYAVESGGGLKQSDKQAYLDGLAELLNDCRKGLKEILIVSERIETLIAPLEEYAVSALYGLACDGETLPYIN